MTSVRRTLSLVIVTLGLALGAPSVAMAGADFENRYGSAGPKGATLTVVRAHAGDDGKVTYEYVTYTATAEGAWVNRVTSAAE
ncbi:hypothetical protein [Nocardiopsis lambiniae]|uniref:Uncharacterized protein n=1 Tax=Nocardiopsis lambiniae TaxID=3075539 RepID=A0ABU2M9Q0_9ACTN|nr:hypothetical protein [Nocardiopsis sp. DSM 44743]MDT0329308.1 hypothetical protein [Nocardiopsis sp. DSM 44743]